MSIVDWFPEYTVNNPVLDAQHQNLFAIVNELHDSLLSKETREDAVAIAIGRLLEYARTHFPEEERQMQAVNFPGLAEHKAAHAELMRKMLDIEKHHKAENESAGPDLLGFLICDWLATHVLSMDKKFSPYLKQ